MQFNSPPRRLKESEKSLSSTILTSVISFLQARSWKFYVKLVVWIGLYYLFIQIEFGVIYFLLTCFYLIFANMGHTKPGEIKGPSAYSVFNEGKNLPGSFSAEGLERAFNIPKYK